MIDDLSDWTASSFSSIPTASTSGAGTLPHSPLRVQAARSAFRNSVVRPKSKAGISLDSSSGLGAGLGEGGSEDNGMRTNVRRDTRSAPHLTSWWG